MTEVTKIKKHETDDPIYIFGQVPVHILFALVFGLLFLGVENKGLVFFSWFVIALFLLMVLLDLINLISFFKKIVRNKNDAWNYILNNLYKENYSFSSVDTTRTIGMIVAFPSFLLLPELLNNHPIFSYPVALSLIFIGFVTGSISLFLSFLVCKSSKFENKTVSLTSLTWMPFILFVGFGNIYAYLSYSSGSISHKVLSIVQLPLIAAFLIATVGIYYSIVNAQPRIKKIDFLLWYVPLIIPFATILLMLFFYSIRIL